MKKLSIAIVNWNTKELLDNCLASILKSTNNIDYEIIVVDNASTDDSIKMLNEKYSSKIKIIQNNNNVGFAYANNQAFEMSFGEYFLLLNSDTICKENSLSILCNFLDSNVNAGAAGPLTLNEDETLQYSWAKFPKIITEFKGIIDRSIITYDGIITQPKQLKDIGPFQADWIGGACLLVKRQVIEQIGLMDTNLFMYSEETDWCYRMRKVGWEIWVVPDSEIIHLGGRSSAQVPIQTMQRLADSKIKFFRKHYGLFSALLLRYLLTIKALLKSLQNILLHKKNNYYEESKRQFKLAIHLLTGKTIL
ncbi:MAG: glycosyltransferase family 2 protein [Armatimonadota bacterium]